MEVYIYVDYKDSFSPSIETYSKIQIYWLHLLCVCVCMKVTVREIERTGG